MRHLACLLIIAVALLVPANVLAQTERVAQATQAAPSAYPQSSSNGAQASSPVPDKLSFPKAVSYPKLGTRMKVRLNDKQEITGSLTEVHRDYFVLTDKGIAQKIMQADVVSMKTNQSFWRRVNPFLLPFKVIGVAAALPPLGAWLLVSEIIREIRGKSKD
jgi:hypothetical protein